jgi:hypothetical protein
MSPYAVTAAEVTQTLGTSLNRIGILRGWLGHRAALRALGLRRGFQWLDGSFVEAKEPQDIDAVSFLRRPIGLEDPATFQAFIVTPKHPRDEGFGGAELGGCEFGG